jgi:hypothetical protein
VNVPYFYLIQVYKPEPLLSRPFRNQHFLTVLFTTPLFGKTKKAKKRSIELHHVVYFFERLPIFNGRMQIKVTLSQMWR